MIEELLAKLPFDLITAMKNCEQNKSWHLEDLFEHTVLVMEGLIEKGARKDLIIAAIFHDLGKLDTTTKEIKNGVETIHHFGHENASMKYLDKLLHLYYNEIEDKNRIYSVVKEHMRAHKYDSGEMSNPNKRKAFEELPYFKDIILFSECDTNGSRRV